MKRTRQRVGTFCFRNAQERMSRPGTYYVVHMWVDLHVFRRTTQ
jgi:hypothetical protein